MQYNTKLGLILFVVYLLLYGGFVLLNSFDPGAMEDTPLAGINKAILYGFGLIIAAFVLAMVYGIACRPEEDSPSDNFVQSSAASESGSLATDHQGEKLS